MDVDKAQRQEGPAKILAGQPSLNAFSEYWGEGADGLFFETDPLINYLYMVGSIRYFAIINTSKIS